jgi:hypothetical protein
VCIAAACVDKAKADYDLCVERQKAYDVPGAYSACAAAVAADPKSVSGQAAAKDFENLKTVVDKLQAEKVEKSERDKAITKDEPPPPPRPSATASAAPIPISAQAQALYANGDVVGARALLEPRVLQKKGALDEANLLKMICKAQKDKQCIATLAQRYR